MLKRTTLNWVAAVLLSAACFSQPELRATVRCLEAVAPVYPLLALYARKEGAVRVRVQLNEAGAVTEAAAVSGPPLLREPAVEAAKLWRFAAGPRELELIFNFVILPRGAPEQDLAARARPPFEIEVRRTVPEATIDRDPPTEVIRKP